MLLGYSNTAFAGVSLSQSQRNLPKNILILIQKHQVSNFDNSKEMRAMKIIKN